MPSSAVPKIPRASAIAPGFGTASVRRSVESINSVQRAIDRIGATSRMLGLGTAESTTARMLHGGPFNVGENPAIKAMSRRLTAQNDEVTVKHVAGLSFGAKLPEDAVQTLMSQTVRTMGLGDEVTRRRLDRLARGPFAATDGAVEKIAKSYAPRVSVPGADLKQVFDSAAKATGRIDAAAIGKWEGLSLRPFAANQNSISRILKSYAPLSARPQLAARSRGRSLASRGCRIGRRRKAIADSGVGVFEDAYPAQG